MWGGVIIKGTTELTFLNGKQDALGNVYLLLGFTLPFAYRQHGLDYVLQQVNAAIHTTREHSTSSIVNK